jgi:hypothetical protein
MVTCLEFCLNFAFNFRIRRYTMAAADAYQRREGEMVEATVVVRGRDGEYLLQLDDGRDLHSSTFQLNLSRF